MSNQANQTDEPKHPITNFIVGAVVGLAVIVPAYKSMNPGPMSAETLAETCTTDRYGSMAFVMAQAPVKARLSDPASASFGNRPNSIIVDRATCTFTIRGRVSARNGFGGRVQAPYTVQIKRNGNGTWSTLSADVIG
ncbi:MAG: hypothetical protein AAFY19_00850 [Pseudomonadota bacterium]